MAEKGLRSVPQRVDREEGEHGGGNGDRRQHDERLGAGVGASPVPGDADEQEDHQ